MPTRMQLTEQAIPSASAASPYFPNVQRSDADFFVPMRAPERAPSVRPDTHSAISPRS